MMFEFDADKALEALLYAAQRTPQHDMYKALKVLYVADKLHLERYGRLIYGEEYAALPYGPVPQHAYDAAKAAANPWTATRIPKARVLSALERKHRTLRPLRDPDVAELSKSDVECLDEAIRDLAFDSMEEIKRKTHDSAWKKTASARTMQLDAIIDALPEGRRQPVREYRAAFAGNTEPDSFPS